MICRSTADMSMFKLFIKRHIWSLSFRLKTKEGRSNLQCCTTCSVQIATDLQLLSPGLCRIKRRSWFVMLPWWQKSQQTAVLGIWYQNQKKWHVFMTLAHTYLPSLSTMQVVEIQKCFFYNGNVTSQAFSCAVIKCGVNFHWSSCHHTFSLTVCP